jgi:hypothetical protein
MERTPELTSIFWMHEKADGRALGAIDVDVGKGRHTHEVNSRRGKKTARNGDSFDGLIERASTDCLKFDLSLVSYDTGDRSGHGVRLALGRHPQRFHSVSPCVMMAATVVLAVL